MNNQKDTKEKAIDQTLDRISINLERFSKNLIGAILPKRIKHKLEDTGVKNDKDINEL